METLTDADRVWALRHRTRTLAPAHLVHLAVAVGGDPLEHAVEIEGLRVELATAREQVRTLVRAITERWSNRRDPALQVADALKALDQVRAYLLSLHEPQARAG